VYTFLPLYVPVALSVTFFSAAFESAVSFKSSVSSAAVFLVLATVFLVFAAVLFASAFALLAVVFAFVSVFLASLSAASLKRLSGVPSFLSLVAFSSTSFLVLVVFALVSFSASFYLKTQTPNIIRLIFS